VSSQLCMIPQTRSGLLDLTVQPPCPFSRSTAGLSVAVRGAGPELGADGDGALLRSVDRSQPRGQLENPRKFLILKSAKRLIPGVIGSCTGRSRTGLFFCLEWDNECHLHYFHYVLLTFYFC